MTELSPGWVSQYLACMGIDSRMREEEKQSLAFLQQICTAHLNTFAFENISKFIYYRDRNKNGYFVPPVETFVDNHQKYGFGGTCYTLNTNLYGLLEALGYDCHLAMLGGEHMSILVRLPELGDERVFVDCGAAAPFFAPVRFETDAHNVTRFGNDRVHIRPVPGEPGKYEYTRYISDTPSGKPWRFEVNHRSDLADFHPLIQAANEPGATFMTILRCQLWQLDKARSVSLVNNVLSIRYSDGTTVKTVLHTVEQIEQVISDEFGLAKLPVREAIQVLSGLGVDIFKAESTQ